MTDAKEVLAKEQEARKKANEDAEKRMSSRPTPTQEENDLARLGAPVENKQDDGSGPEIILTLQPKQSEPASKPAAAGYQTRQAKPAT